MDKASLNTGRHRRASLAGVDEKLFELAVGIGVCGELQGSGRIDELKLSEGHAATEFGIGLAEG